MLPFSIPSLVHSSSAASVLPEIARAVLNLAEIEKAEETITVARNAADNQSFLLVFQTPQQRKWLARYGNTVTCMDAIYKTLKYGFPCFFLVAKTAIGKGCVIGTIIPQYETEELIAEGLTVISAWNPGWCPDFFMTDESAQELSKLNTHIF